MGIVYCIYCLPNNKKYIGITTKSLSERFNKHCSDSKRRKCRFYNAIRKYGINNFIIGIIEECEDYNLLKEREKYYIDLYGTYKNGYNSTLGGEGSLGRRHSPEAKEKLRQAHLGRKQ